MSRSLTHPLFVDGPDYPWRLLALRPRLAAGVP